MLQALLFVLYVGLPKQLYMSLPFPASPFFIPPQATATALADSAMIASLLNATDVFVQTQARAFAAARQTPKATQVRRRVGFWATPGRAAKYLQGRLWARCPSAECSAVWSHRPSGASASRRVRLVLGPQTSKLSAMGYGVPDHVTCTACCAEIQPSAHLFVCGLNCGVH